MVEFPYSDNSSESLARLTGLAWPVFLDSGHPHYPEGRYDILSAEPRCTLTTHGPITRIQSASATRWSFDDPFLLLQQQLNGLNRQSEGLPFTGGAIGYFGYDLGRRIERLPELAKADQEMPEMALGIYDWALVVDHKEQRSWLTGHCPDRVLIALRRAVRTHQSPLLIGSKLHSNMDREAYYRAFNRIQNYIRDGDCYQVNLARRFSLAVEGDPVTLYNRLRGQNPAPFGACLLTPYGSVMSLSPERFLRVRNGEVETCPIKGTRPRDADPERDRILARELSESPKDRAENIMIVDLLRNDLGKSCAVGSVQVPALLELESFSNVHHLVSRVTGRLAPDADCCDLLRGCFPGGSITGAPKLRAMEIIEELEPHRRGVYCGAIGYLGYDGNMDTNIAIRTLVKRGSTAHFWAGGGIVADSQPEMEYREILDKASVMRGLLQGVTSGLQ